jgi:hypothetical protein
MKIGEAKSSLIKELSYDSEKQTMTVVYRDDAEKFAYRGISPGLFGALKRAKHPGETWIRIRDNYDYDRVK